MRKFFQVTAMRSKAHGSGEGSDVAPEEGDDIFEPTLETSDIPGDGEE